MIPVVISFNVKGGATICARRHDRNGIIFISKKSKSYESNENTKNTDENTETNGMYVCMYVCMYAVVAAIIVIVLLLGGSSRG